jgi:crotonobetainyl-CoA:carnitine CoA-transferase CaiB-like acyl-CoA transferase
VLNWDELMAHEGFKVLDMLQTVTREDNVSITTTRAPLRIDGKRPKTSRAAPLIGEQSAAIRREFGL